MILIKLVWKCNYWSSIHPALIKKNFLGKCFFYSLGWWHPRPNPPLLTQHRNKFPFGFCKLQKRSVSRAWEERKRGKKSRGGNQTMGPVYSCLEGKELNWTHLKVNQGSVVLPLSPVSKSCSLPPQNTELHITGEQKHQW